jgi:hypothetical protein
VRAGVPACVRACVRAGGRACMCNLPWATATSASAFLRSDVWASCSQAARALLFHARTHTPSHLQTHILCSQAARALLFHARTHTPSHLQTHILCSQAARALLFHCTHAHPHTYKHTHYVLKLHVRCCFIARTHTPSHLQTHILCSQAARALLFHCTHAHTLTPTNTHIMFSSCSCVAVSLHARTHPRTYKHTHACMHDVRRLFFSIASDAPSLFMHAFCCADEWP